MPSSLCVGGTSSNMRLAAVHNDVAKDTKMKTSLGNRQSAFSGLITIRPMQCFVNVMEGLGTEWQVGHPAEIRAAEPRKQQHGWRDADLILTLLVEDRFPAL
jgi:hypothetical protein